MKIEGTLKDYSDLELSLMTICGYYGNGNTRKQKLGARYDAVQKIVNKITNGTVPKGNGGYCDSSKLAIKINDALKSEMVEFANEIANSYNK